MSVTARRVHTATQSPVGAGVVSVRQVRAVSWPVTLCTTAGTALSAVTADSMQPPVILSVDAACAARAGTDRDVNTVRQPANTLPYFTSDPSVAFVVCFTVLCGRSNRSHYMSCLSFCSLRVSIYFYRNRAAVHIKRT